MDQHGQRRPLFARQGIRRVRARPASQFHDQVRVVPGFDAERAGRVEVAPEPAPDHAPHGEFATDDAPLRDLDDGRRLALRLDGEDPRVELSGIVGVQRAAGLRGQRVVAQSLPRGGRRSGLVRIGRMGAGGPENDRRPRGQRAVVRRERGQLRLMPRRRPQRRESLRPRRGVRAQAPAQRRQE